MNDAAASMEWLTDLEIEVTEQDVMGDLDPAILLWQQALAPTSA